MLSNLKKVQDNLFSNESIEIFLKYHNVFDLIELLNKANKSQTKIRIKRFFYKITESQHYQAFLMAGLTTNKHNKKQFGKYISSQHSEEYFELLQKREKEIVQILESEPKNILLIFSLVQYQGGIKMIKFISDLYAKFQNSEILYADFIRQEFEKGLEDEDSVVQMRFVQILANIGLRGGKCFKFVADLLERSLHIYTTNDILLKLNIVQIVSSLGEGEETAKLLKEHEIWSYVEKDALNPDQQFYVRKNLLMLLVQMFNNGLYEINHKFTKNTISFLGDCLSSKGEFIEGALDLICCLFKTNEGTKIVVQNKEVFTMFLAISLTTNDQLRNQYITTLISLTDKLNGKKMKAIVINMLSSIGNPNLSGQFSHNISSNHYTTEGIEQFCQWLCYFMALPFEDLELNLIDLFTNLLQYPEICEFLFEEQKFTKFILKPIGSSLKKTREKKNRLVGRLIEKGENEWKGSKLQPYSKMVEKELQKSKMELEVDMMADG